MDSHFHGTRWYTEWVQYEMIDRQNKRVAGERGFKTCALACSSSFNVPGMCDARSVTSVSYPPFLGDLALSLQLGSSLSSLQDAVVLFGIDVERFLLEHLGPRQGDTLHCGNCTTSRHHLIEGETQTGTQCLRPLAWKAYMYINMLTHTSVTYKCSS